MKTNKELFHLMLDNQQYFKSGLCSWVDVMWAKSIISVDEYKQLKDYIKNNKPFTLHQVIKNDAYWWKGGNIKPRIKWIIKQIKKL